MRIFYTIKTISHSLSRYHVSYIEYFLSIYRHKKVHVLLLNSYFPGRSLPSTLLAAHDRQLSETLRCICFPAQVSQRDLIAQRTRCIQLLHNEAFSRERLLTRSLNKDEYRLVKVEPSRTNQFPFNAFPLKLYSRIADG